MKIKAGNLFNLSASFFCIAIFSCAPIIPNIVTAHDDFEGFTTNRMVGNRLKLYNVPDFAIIMLGSTPTILFLDAQRYISKEGDISYSLIVDYSGPNWLFIKSGESLILLIDNEPIKLSGTGSSIYRDVTNVVGDIRINERSIYPISPDLLKKIAYASDVQVKLIGEKLYHKAQFDSSNFDRFKEFVEKFVE